MVERDLAKVEVAGSSPVSRSITPIVKITRHVLRKTMGTPTAFHLTGILPGSSGSW